MLTTEQMTTMKISDYMSYAKLFPYMSMPEVTAIGEQLDAMLVMKFGQRTIGSVIQSHLNADGVVEETDQKTIAMMIEIMYKNKWTQLLKFGNEEYDPLVQMQSTTTTTYGRKVEEDKSGTDNYTDVNGIAGFDSADFVDSSQLHHEIEYGNKYVTQNSGENVIESKKRDTQAERLVDYTLQFWERHGVTETVLHDAVKMISLPLYSLD